ncbi:hypothetical protein [Thalassotalea profundi]|uniref:DUF2570 domain-containing protein n=1 Tax=Thalassotalea profundi TaxID=2036687 RepID=A0ABQ3IFP1_9GAMM|nr:hypothetical protein [Thalassotalea profundi]GHE82849.1 hypothetical protein GCM10011501_08960 [Thalassotalea profundi]
MEFSIKNILIVILSLFFAFTLYWFVKFGTIFWFLGYISEEASRKNVEYQRQIQLKNENIKIQKQLTDLKKQEAYKKRMFISSGDHSRKIPIKEKRCNEAILLAMTDKSKKAKANKENLCNGV